MGTTNALAQVIDQPALDRVAEPLSKGIRNAYGSAGAAGAQLKNAVHGVWLGHPLHPVFTDIPIGAWTTALAMDCAAGDDPGMKRAATFAMGIGLLGALGAAVTGLTDWSETDGQSRRNGLVHGLLNIAATSLMTAAFVQRSNDSHDSGRGFAWAGYGIAVASAWLGGDLVYGQRIGVTHAEAPAPDAFTSVARSEQLAENSMMRARCGDVDVLLVRQQGRVCAMVHDCSHLGGPLSEGTLKDGSVVCPWHGSEFALEDGHVINGPATHHQPVFEVRERDGHIEVRRTVDG
jgi:nitrite reductase/ring-hydroxylating ferredoxin subunit/uncharacterized membrane protein